jgi:hypothetical protein
MYLTKTGALTVNTNLLSVRDLRHNPEHLAGDYTITLGLDCQSNAPSIM